MGITAGGELALPSPARTAGGKREIETGRNAAMAYGLEQRTIAETQAGSGAAAYRAWRNLSPERRLAAVERTLHPAADLGDGYPPAL